MDSSSQPDRHSDCSLLARYVNTLASDLFAAIRLNQPIHPLLDQCSDAAFIKAADGQVLVTNGLFEELFGAEISAVGRSGSDFLDDSIVPVAEASDQMILDGCTFVEMEHQAVDPHGRPCSFRMVKRSLLGYGHPKMAILGVGRRLTDPDESLGQPILQLTRYWRAFRSLEERDREIAVLVAHGKSVKEVAGELGLSEKTIENRRKGILDRMRLSKPVELTKFMVRLQDQGYGDFGL